MSDCSKGSHDWQRVVLNQWDDVTKCRNCSTWLHVHENVRGVNPNFAAKKGRR